MYGCLIITLLKIVISFIIHVGSNQLSFKLQWFDIIFKSHQLVFVEHNSKNYNYQFQYQRIYKLYT